MGAEGSKSVPTEGFETNLSAALKLAQEEGKFCDLVILSATKAEFKVHKIVVSAAFPRLRSYLHLHDDLETSLSDDIIRGLIAYGYSGTLTLNEHFLGVLSALLELVPTERVRERICYAVRDHVICVLASKSDVEKLSTPEMAALVFVAKIHDLTICERLLDWQNQNGTLKNGNLTEDFMILMNYWLKAEKGDLLSPHGWSFVNDDFQ